MENFECACPRESFGPLKNIFYGSDCFRGNKCKDLTWCHLVATTTSQMVAKKDASIEAGGII
jgi:hypothetical protein